MQRNLSILKSVEISENGITEHAEIPIPRLGRMNRRRNLLLHAIDINVILNAPQRAAAFETPARPVRFFRQSKNLFFFRKGMQVLDKRVIRHKTVPARIGSRHDKTGGLRNRLR